MAKDSSELNTTNQTLSPEDLATIRRIVDEFALQIIRALRNLTDECCIQIHSKYAHALCNAKRFDEAFIEYNNAAAENRGRAYLYYKKGDIYNKQEMLDKALVEYSI